MRTTIGKYIAWLLIILFGIKVVVVLFKYMVLQSITEDEAISSMVLLFIPTEVTIVETLAAVPILMLAALLFYWRFVARS